MFRYIGVDKCDRHKMCFQPSGNVLAARFLFVQCSQEILKTVHISSESAHNPGWTELLNLTNDSMFPFLKLFAINLIAFLFYGGYVWWWHFISPFYVLVLIYKMDSWPAGHPQLATIFISHTSVVIMQDIWGHKSSYRQQWSCLQASLPLHIPVCSPTTSYIIAHTLYGDNVMPLAHLALWLRTSKAITIYWHLLQRNGLIVFSKLSTVIFLFTHV